MIKELIDVQTKKLLELKNLLDSLNLFLRVEPKQTRENEEDRVVECLLDEMKRNDDLLNKITSIAIEINKTLRGE